MQFVNQAKHFFEAKKEEYLKSGAATAIKQIDTMMANAPICKQLSDKAWGEAPSQTAERSRVASRKPKFELQTRLEWNQIVFANVSSIFPSREINMKHYRENVAAVEKLDCFAISRNDLGGSAASRGRSPRDEVVELAQENTCEKVLLSVRETLNWIEKGTLAN